MTSFLNPPLSIASNQLPESGALVRAKARSQKEYEELVAQLQGLLLDLAFITFFNLFGFSVCVCPCLLFLLVALLVSAY